MPSDLPKARRDMPVYCSARTTTVINDEATCDLLLTAALLTCGNVVAIDIEKKQTKESKVKKAKKNSVEARDPVPDIITIATDLEVLIVRWCRMRQCTCSYSCLRIEA